MTPPAHSPRWCDPLPANTHPVPQDGRRHCGNDLETVIRRQWPPDQPPPAEVIIAVTRLASQPSHIASRLADALDGLWLGDGKVPDLDDLGHLRGVPVRPGSTVTWDDEPAGLIGNTLAIGTGESLSCSVLDHEIGHVLSVADGMAQRRDWQTIMFLCRQHLVDPRWFDAEEWFAEAYALCATGELSQLVRILDGERQVAQMVWAYYRREYGLEVRGR